MPSVDAKLVWATPVKVEVLGANLEAYINLLPIIQTLRLCNRFGRGAPISRLPAELLLLVEDVLVAQEREITQKAWTRDYQCFSSRCADDDHFSQSEVELMRAEKWDELGWDGKDQEFEELLERHTRNADNWSTRVGERPPDDYEFFAKHAKLIRKHFRLLVWIGHFRQAASAGNWPYFAKQVTYAYLYHPSEVDESHHVSYSEADLLDGPSMTQQSLAVPVDKAKIPRRSKSDRARLRRMMALLDLRPYPRVDADDVEGSDDSDSDSDFDFDKPPDDEEKRPEREIDDWPQLTMLFRSDSSPAW